MPEETDPAIMLNVAEIVWIRFPGTSPAELAVVVRQDQTILRVIMAADLRSVAIFHPDGPIDFWRASARDMTDEDLFLTAKAAGVVRELYQQSTPQSIPAKGGQTINLPLEYTDNFTIADDGEDDTIDLYGPIDGDGPTKVAVPRKKRKPRKKSEPERTPGDVGSFVEL